MTSLEMVYTRDGTLALLKKRPCPHHNKSGYVPLWRCERGGYIETVTAVHVLQPGETEWVWHRCPTRHQADV